MLAAVRQSAPGGGAAGPHSPISSAPRVARRACSPPESRSR